MKPTFITKIIIAAALIVTTNLSAQTNFNINAYQLFLDNNQSLTTPELLNEHPPQTVYYSERQVPSALNTIAWFDSINNHFKLTNYEKELLSKQHFVVSERLFSNDWATPFIKIYSNDLPLFISSDFVLHTLHSSYDAVLMKLETELLEPNLKELLNAMYQSYPSIYSKYQKNVAMRDALADVDLYISVALTLAQNNDFLPQKTDRIMFDKVMSAIAAEKLNHLNLFTTNRLRKFDLSQFKPRGHYTKPIYLNGESRTLENYFKCMMWLGRIDFLMTAPPENPWEEDWTQKELQRMQIGAVLLNELLDNCGKRSLFETHEKTISFLVGPDDNLTPDELSTLSETILSSPADILEEQTYLALTEALNGSDDYGQKIMSNFFYVDPDTIDPGKLPISFRLLGQKFLLDSYITSEVVYDRIKWDNKKIHRGLPDPLDVMAVLGNENALKLLENEMTTYHYAYKVNALEELISQYDEQFWNQSLYNMWLSAIRSLNPPASSKNLPFFMQSVAWQHEKLNTQLTSWAEMRHDNILYGKPSYTGGTGCSFPFTYIEPHPELYDNISHFASEASAFFTDELGLDNTISLFYNNYAHIMSQFSIISDKELKGTVLNETEITFLKTMINSYMSSGPSITGWYNDLFLIPYESTSSDFLVADIHTQPTDAFGNIVGKVYHVGSGYINQGVFLAPNPMNAKQLITYVGPVSSFHYEVKDNFYRMDDEEWGNRFWEHKDIPARPDWVNVYLANNLGESHSKGRTLEGKVFTASQLPKNKTQTVDYLLAFPNPTQDELHLRFVLNRTGEVNIQMYDLTGRTIKQDFKASFNPGEHDIPIQLKGLATGTYLVHFSIDDTFITRKIMIR